MDAWRKMIVFLSLFTIVFSVCTCWKLQTFMFVKYNTDGVGLNLLSCTRFATVRKYCGCEINLHSNNYDGLVKEWSENRTIESGYAYMETKQLTIVSSLTPVDHKWFVRFHVPMCLDPGSMIDVSFTPRAGWTILKINLINKAQDNPMKIDIRNNDRNVAFMSSVAISEEICEDFPFVTNETHYLRIEIREYSYKVSVNGTQYYEFNQTLTELVPTYLAFFMIDVQSELHYIQFRKSEE